MYIYIYYMYIYIYIFLRVVSFLGCVHEARTAFSSSMNSLNLKL